ncbi:MAG TPA: diacylglycerol kinase family lipid kinase [Bacillota bacterium]|nr:diacylglycerol kinase family lipid kinase [Bacillota bacterium]
MKHIFIINPAAGKGRAGKVFLPEIIATAKRLGIDYEIHRTIAPLDAMNFAKRRCEESLNRQDGDILRFYACGGDGTFNEVVNGLYGYENIEAAMIPAGTGNDFPRNFGGLKCFEDIEKQIRGEARPVDIIRYEAVMANPVSGSLEYDLDRLYESDPDPVVRYGVNMFNIGLDCNVADKAAQIKQYLFVPGSLAYGLGVGIILGKKEGVNLEIALDNGEIYDGGIMLIAIGNGCYCGGGFKCLPRAKTDDGLIDVSIVGNISRRRFLSLIGKYRKGTHLEDPAAAGFITYRQCRSLTIRTSKAVKLSSDGEISIVGETTFEIIPKGIKFSVPQGCE